MQDKRHRGPDRRKGERRVQDIPVAVERRRGRDRRWAFRRDEDINAAIQKMIELVRVFKENRDRLQKARKPKASPRKPKSSRPKPKPKQRKKVSRAKSRRRGR